ncbi:MAG: cation-transporting P-type ATPase, partial [Planctomycetota bacterium]|nr:cation-transporting P-type ATPase [Planctomycetota bacterium]
GNNMNIKQIQSPPPAEVFGLLQSRVDGLTDKEVSLRLQDSGPNVLHDERRFSWSQSLLRHSFNFFSLLLYISAAFCFVAQHLEPKQQMAVLGWALIGVAILNAVFAFVQEYRAERAMEELKKFLPPQARVRRQGREMEVPAKQLVPGDVLLLAEGDQIAADARIVESTALLVNNAPLTGESRSQPLTAAPAQHRVLDSTNIAFAGCLVQSGAGVAVVFATGPHAEFGRIASLSQQISRAPSPLEREIRRMVRILTTVAVSMGVIFFTYGFFTGRPLWVNVVFMLGIIVANVPEGLLPTFTLALSMASLRMARKNVLVKSLEAIETLGAIHVICTDKTGTLTRNELTLANTADPIHGEPLTECGLTEILEAALVASQVHEREGTLAGDPLDVAVAEAFERQVGPIGPVVQSTRRHFPFDLKRRREAGLLINGSRAKFAAKGAWENLRPLIGELSHCETQPPTAVSEERLCQCDAIVRDLARQGYRIIAVASHRLAGPPEARTDLESLERRLTLLGFLALEDPVREGVPAAMQRCHEAGIRVVMITGDHPETALAVGRRCGLATDEETIEQRVLHGDQLDHLSDDELSQLLQTGLSIFARTTPEQKTKIIAACKRLGWIVGMTGDGVNDAPALKAADVGIAMGQGGTDVARESADLVLLDNHFTSIVAGVEEGRGIFTNMQKFTSYVLTSNVPEIVPYLLYVALPVPLALTVIQILSVDLGTDLIPAMGLGQEPPEPDTMRRPPRHHGHLLSKRLMLLSYLFLGMIQAGWSLSMFFLVLFQGGWQFGQQLPESSELYRSATGITLATVILMQIGNLIGRRTLTQSGLDRGLFTNKLFLIGIGVEIAFSWAVLYWPPLQAILGTAPVAWQVYLLAWLGVPLIFGLDYLRKVLAALALNH